MLACTSIEECFSSFFVLVLIPFKSILPLSLFDFRGMKLKYCLHTHRPLPYFISIDTRQAKCEKKVVKYYLNILKNHVGVGLKLSQINKNEMCLVGDFQKIIKYFFPTFSNIFFSECVWQTGTEIFKDFFSFCKKANSKQTASCRVWINCYFTNRFNLLDGSAIIMRNCMLECSLKKNPFWLS